MTDRIRHPGVLIVGAGLAGLSAALAAAPRRVLLVAGAPVGQGCASGWAQGGLAAAVGDGDTPEQHARDTLLAAAGLADADAVGALTLAGPETVRWLAELGAPFDRTPDGGFATSLEAAHGQPRVVRVGGDGAGRAILDAVWRAVAASAHIELLTARLRSLLQDTHCRIGGVIVERDGRLVEIVADAVVLATGGVGGLFEVTTNPASVTGDGLGLAALAGAEIRDAEFVQFHPTALDLGLDPAPLATEALRGEGARLIDAEGRPLVTDHPLGDLAPRDIVARAVHRARLEGRGAFLDARDAIGAEMPERFPAVFAACLAAGLDPRVQPMPVAPAAHYHMGGIAADVEGRTSLEGLFAAGECAATGVHGANRLASNSLLEAAAFGRMAGRAAADLSATGSRNLHGVAAPDLTGEAMRRLRTVMSACAGVEREADRLVRLFDVISELELRHGVAAPLAAARLIAEGALDRRESRGGHCRSDFPETLSEARSSRVRLQPMKALAAE